MSEPLAAGRCGSRFSRRRWMSAGGAQDDIARREAGPRSVPDRVRVAHARWSSGPAAEATGSRIRVLGWPSRHGRLHRLRWGWTSRGLDRSFGRPLRHNPRLALQRRGARGVDPAPVRNPDPDRRSRANGRLQGALRTPGSVPGRQARRSSDVVVAASEAVRYDVIRHEHIEPAKTRVIRNGVVLPPPMPPSERSAIRAPGASGPTISWSAASPTTNRPRGSSCCSASQRPAIESAASAARSRRRR